MQLIAIATIFIISVHLSTSLHQQLPTPPAQSPPPPTTSPAPPASPPLPETTTYNSMELTCQQPPTTSCSLLDLAYPTHLQHSNGAHGVTKLHYSCQKETTGGRGGGAGAPWEVPAPHSGAESWEKLQSFHLHIALRYTVSDLGFWSLLVGQRKTPAAKPPMRSSGRLATTHCKPLTPP